MTILLTLSMTTIFLFFLSPHNHTMFLSFSLLPLNSMNIELSMIFDWMTTIFLSTVLMITLTISMYSHAYINTKEHKRFMLIMFLFALSMLILITSNNMILLLLGWDGLGLTSYALVIYYQNANTNASGTITILTNRLGDIALLTSFAILYSLGLWNMNMNNFFSISTLFLFLTAAITKSAQFPFSAWLPAAMAAPTPISALVHSSTLVTAGVFLMIRLSSKFHPLSMKFLMTLAMFTTIFASISAMWEQDMKKIIALSTLSQIAIMMFAITINTKTTAFFHLITHALFKSTMFLCAGNIIHNTSYQDSRSMGALYPNMPTMSATLGVSSMALMGLPFTAGFFSKDAIMEFMMFSSSNLISTLIMISSISMTAIYTLRMISTASPTKTKSNPDTTLTNNPQMSWPPFFMAPLSLTLGSTLVWMLPTQTLIMPPYLFLAISMALTTGMLMSTLLSFKSKTYSFLGNLSIHMWFIHPLTTNPWLKSLPLSTLFTKIDNSWHENLSAQGMQKTLMSFNYTTQNLLKTSLTLTILLTAPLLLM